MEVLVLMLILILIIFLIVESFINNIERFNNNEIIYYKKKNLYNILKKDEDKYFQSFFKNDLKVRNINNLDEYYNIMYESICDPDDAIIDKITNYIIKIKSKINSYKNSNSNYFNSVDLIKFNNIQWKIGFVCNNKYENGLPHTRNNIIILNKNSINLNSDLKNMKTLIHEQIHIYQKLYIKDVKNYLDSKKFKKLKKITEYDNIRANPDLDNYIYQDKYHNTYKALYNNNPKSIEDITYYPHNSQYYEHPYERMAIEFESIIDN